MSIMYRLQQSEVVKIVTGPAMYRQDSKTKTTKRKATQNKTHHNTTPTPPPPPPKKTTTTQKQCKTWQSKRQHKSNKYKTNQTTKQKQIKPQIEPEQNNNKKTRRL